MNIYTKKLLSALFILSLTPFLVGFELRPVQDSDKPEIQKFFEGPIDNAYAGYPESRGGREVTMQVLFNKKEKRYHTQVCLSGKQVAGFICYQISKEEVAALEKKKPAEVDLLLPQEKEQNRYLISLGVIKEYRNQGVATALVQKMIDDYKLLKLVSVEVNIKKGNDPADRFYQKMGFIKKLPEDCKYKRLTEKQIQSLKEEAAERLILTL